MASEEEIPWFCEVDPTSWAIADPKKNLKGGLTAYINTRPGFKRSPEFQLGWGRAIFGLRDEWDEKKTEPFYRFNCELQVDPSTPEGAEMCAFFDRMDEHILDVAASNSKAWFKTEVSKEDLRARYRSTVQRDTSDKGYNPLIRVKIQHNPPATPGGESNQTKIWESRTNPDGTEDLLEFNDRPGQEGAPFSIGVLDNPKIQLRPLVVASGIWFVGKQFGVTLYATDVAVVLPQKKATRSKFTNRGGGAIPIRKVAENGGMAVDHPDTVIEVPAPTGGLEQIGGDETLAAPGWS